ncbi:MAG: hypothetical protein WBC76_00510 [Actinomycetes bacterium]|jgi:hypothetical protein|nr:hypothetical protein [Actinomycetes bacterium]HUV48265.1 hypothetical protein [Actinomycetes bacterium]
MAKAILGHIGGPDPRLLAEVARLRRRVSDLQSEVERLTAENEALLPETIGESLADEIITLDAASPDRSAPALA